MPSLDCNRVRRLRAHRCPDASDGCNRWLQRPLVSCNGSRVVRGQWYDDGIGLLEAICASAHQDDRIVNVGPSRSRSPSRSESTPASKSRSRSTSTGMEWPSMRRCQSCVDRGDVVPPHRRSGPTFCYESWRSSLEPHPHPQLRRGRPDRDGGPRAASDQVPPRGAAV